jgi:hypothetical protein
MIPSPCNPFSLRAFQKDQENDLKHPPPKEKERKKTHKVSRTFALEVQVS